MTKLTNMLDIITIGDATVDTFIIIDHDEASLQCDLRKDNCLLCLNYADKIPISKTHQSIGGNAANIAVACKKLGLNTAIVTEVGDDINGLAIKHELDSKNIDTQFLKINKKQETRYGIILNYQGERTVLSSYVRRNYTFPKLPKTKWIYYSSLGENFEKIQSELVKYLQKNKEVKLAVNPGSYQIKKKLNDFKKILPFVEILFVNKEEAEKITGKKAAIPQLIKLMHNLGPKTVVITNSTNGSSASNGNQIFHLPIFANKVVDKTGAGDAYAGGFLSAIHYGKPIEEAMQWGTANSAGVIQKIGAHEGLLNQKEITKCIQKFNGLRPVTTNRRTSTNLQIATNTK